MTRTRPYTDRGIRRVPCARCGAPSVHQWNICSLGRTFHGMCTACDIELNRTVLEFLGTPNASAIIANYRRKCE